jgi:iron-sulfur cluster assembly protein
MAIEITERAAQQIDKQLSKRGSGLGLRIGVKTAGCSGYAYTLDYADEAGSDDALFEQHGVTVLVPKDALDKLDGLTLDYVREGFNESFKFNNPNVKGTCGCGESFAV